MFGKETNSTSFRAGVAGDASESEQASNGTPIDPRRMAELVASGDLPLPQHLPLEQLDRLARDVQQLRRQRLVQFVARVIANDIYNARRSKQGG